MVNHLGYSDILMDHFDHPRNAGELKDADGIGQAGEAGGDVTTFWIRVREDCINEITFKCRGCPPAIAAASITTELAKGKHLDDASHITQDTIVSALGSMPAPKRHVAGMAAEALANAIMDYVVRCVENKATPRKRRS